MCGFIGVIADEIKLTEAAVAEAGKVLSHRGPDNVSIYRDKRALLVHNRLSIIDLSAAANQPMISKSGTVLVFNGEIYNYKELKTRYSNIKWETSSDTEVILKLYEELGSAFVNQLEGIFAFAIYNPRKGQVFFCRDRFGIKPLYFAWQDKVLLFSSEIKGIGRFKKTTFNYQAIYDYLKYGSLAHDAHTFYEGVSTLEPAHYMVYDMQSGKGESTQYWDVPSEQAMCMKEEYVYEKTNELLCRAIKLNLVSDVEVAISLSSGIDSALLLKMMQEHTSELKAFTYGFEEEEYDEVHRVKDNLDLLNAEHVPVYLAKKNMLRTLREAVFYFETPLGGLGTLSAYNMMKTVRAHNIKVMLSGEGSDEVFGGYKYYYFANLSDISDKGRFREELSGYARMHGLTEEKALEEHMRLLPFLKTPLVLAPDGTSAMTDYLGSRFAGFRDTEIKLSKVSSDLRQVMWLDLRSKKLPKLLHFQDRASMASSVETRVPFLSTELVDHMYGLPSEYIISGGTNKYMLRKILTDKYKLGRLCKIKHYVSTPQREWLKDAVIRDEILQTLRSGELVKQGLINFEKFATDYMAYSKSPELGNSFFIWKLINLEYLMSCQKI